MGHGAICQCRICQDVRRQETRRPNQQKDEDNVINFQSRKSPEGKEALKMVNGAEPSALVRVMDFVLEKLGVIRKKPNQTKSQLTNRKDFDAQDIIKGKHPSGFQPVVPQLMSKENMPE